MSSSTARSAPVAAALAAALIAVPAAEAKKFDVKPGKGTLQKAIDKARNGDKLKLEKKGVYKGGVVIEKRLTITGPSDRKKLPTINGQCRVAFTMLVLSSPVTIQNLKVTGASDEAGGTYGGADINFIEGGAGAAIGVKLDDGCGVQYGVNVFDTGDVLIDENEMKGYDDAGVYVGGIRDPNTVVEVTDNVAEQNNRGILIEDSFGNAGILVSNNTASGQDNGFTPVGVFLFNSDGVVVAGNTTDSNAFAGVWADQNSDDNRIIDNTASGNGTTAQGGPGADLVNDGQRNCGSGNSFGTTMGNPLGAC
ncbi:MAG: right-handed parallel beta-helix repeat-containing protein [Solirubrobacterales bacterium]